MARLAARRAAVGGTEADRPTAFDIAEDGDLSNRRVFAEEVGPDGICVDADGAVWTGDGGTACVRVREGGAVLDRVELDRWPFATMLGGPDRRTLFVMARDGIRWTRSAASAPGRC